MILSEAANTNDGGDTTPLAHTACVTAGSTSVTSVHEAACNVTANVAVRALTWIHELVICPHSNPSSTVAVTTTSVVLVPSYGPPGLATYTTPVVTGNAIAAP